MVLLHLKFVVNGRIVGLIVFLQTNDLKNLKKTHTNKYLTNSLLLQKELIIFDLVSAPSANIPLYLFASQLF